MKSVEHDLHLNPLLQDDVRRFQRYELECIQEESPRSTILKLLSYQEVIGNSLRIKQAKKEEACKKCRFPQTNTARYLPPFNSDPFPAFLPKIPPYSKFVQDKQSAKKQREEIAKQERFLHTIIPTYNQNQNTHNQGKIIVRMPRLPPLLSK